MTTSNKTNRKFSSKKKFFAFITVIILLLTGLGNPQPAQADPHAMFYTAIGQQQLFFNVLAALDQADYVETSQLREEKRKAREEVSAEPPFERETESGGRFTTETELQQFQEATSENYQDQPGEPALVNRQVTLEGADLYTDELVREYGAEFARRNAASELLVALCENGFNFEECDYDRSKFDSDNDRVLKTHIMETKRRNAAIVEPLDGWALLPLTNGVFAALNSGNPTPNIVNPNPNAQGPLTDEQYRQAKIVRPDIFGWEPVAYSKEIAEWRQRAAQLGPKHQEALQKLIDSIIDKYYEPPNTPFPYQERDFNENSRSGLIGLTYEKQICGNSVPCLNLVPESQGGAPAWSIAREPGMTPSKYIEKAEDMISEGQSRVSEIANTAAIRISMQQETVEDEGVIAKTFLKQHPIPDLTGYGELTANIDTPVAARKSSIYGIPNVLGQLATSQQASSLKGLDVPGNKQLVKRGSETTSTQPECSDGIDNDGDGFIDYDGGDQGCTSPDDDSENSENILGATTTSPRVASALDLLFNPQKHFWDEERKETSPSANIISPILEYGARHSLRVLTAGKWRPGNSPTCGFTCD